MGTRRTFTKEFKAQAVQLVTDQGRSVADVAGSLGVGENLLRRWKQRLATEGAEAFRGNGNRTAEADELRRLREENRRLKMERDILKKATAFFARESG
jgi:transposase